MFSHQFPELSMEAVLLSITAPSTTCSSSLTLPGQSYVSSNRKPDVVKSLAGRFERLACFLRKCRANSAISPTRSRSGGNEIYCEPDGLLASYIKLLS